MNIIDENGTLHTILLFDKNNTEWFLDFSCEEGGIPLQNFSYDENLEVYVGKCVDINFWVKEIEIYLATSDGYYIYETKTKAQKICEIHCEDEFEQKIITECIDYHNEVQGITACGTEFVYKTVWVFSDRSWIGHVVDNVFVYGNKKEASSNAGCRITL